MLWSRAVHRRVDVLRMSPLSTAELHGRLASDLSGWFRRRTSEDRVDDLVQETFLRVHEGLPGLRDPERVGAWVFQIARRTLADHLRRRPPEQSLDATAGVEPQAAAVDPFDDPTAVVASWLPAMVDTLPEPYREALRLTELEGMSQAELAARLGVSPSGARSRVQRGRQRLLASLEACCEVRREGASVIDWRPRAEACGGCD